MALVRFFWRTAIIACCAAAIGSPLGCSNPGGDSLPSPGRHFFRIGAGDCDTLDISQKGALSGTPFCPEPGRIEPGFFSPPAIACADGRRYGITRTLDGFALTEGRQVLVFVFPTLAACRAGLPPPLQNPTL